MIRSFFAAVSFCVTLYFFEAQQQLALAAALGSSEEEITIEELIATAKTPDGRRFYTGDLIIYYDEVSTKAAVAGGRWTRGEFVFHFGDQTSEQRQLFRDACAAWTINTPVRCVERTNQANFVSVITHDGSGCGGDAVNVSCSAIGMVRGAQELQVYIDHWNIDSRWVIEHEIGHALGLVHEQSRSDRDNYVIINGNNIKPNAIHNFRKWDSALVVSDYDYASVMHYNNCAFSTQISLCRPNDRGTEHYWTISPIPCALDRVGGNVITSLDLDGIRRAYGGPVFALYDVRRDGTCGTHAYSKTQVERTCGASCASAGSVSWSRIHTEYDWGCGFMVILDGPRFCESRRQEFRAQWYDKDPVHSQCYGGTLTERWTECGCTVQALQGQCADIGGPINVSQLEKLLSSNDLHEREVGQFLQTMLEYDRKGFLESSVVEASANTFMHIYARGDSSSIHNTTCDLRVQMTLQRVLNKHYKMSLASFNSIIGRHISTI